MVLDRYDFCSPVRRRSYPKPPVEVRLQRWFKRASENSQFMRTSKSSTRMKLTKSIVRGLGLESPIVIIEQKGGTVVLLSPERNCPLAELSTA